MAAFLPWALQMASDLHPQVASVLEVLVDLVGLALALAHPVEGQVPWEALVWVALDILQDKAR